MIWKGCLEPVKVIIPDGCLLSPSEDAAVVGGNVTTSQRIVDLIFKVFKVCAASQVIFELIKNLSFIYFNYFKGLYEQYYFWKR